MGVWVDGEESPDCFCGMAAGVYIDEDGKPGFLCIFHEAAHGSLFPLPKEKPDNWLNLTVEELKEVLRKGSEEDNGND